MDSSFLCVIVIGLVFQALAQDQFHTQWHTNLQKINEGNKKRNELANYRVSDVLVAEELSLPSAHPPPPRTTPMTPEMDKAYLVCTEKTKVEPDTISRIRRGNWRIYDPMAKPWVHCILVENKLMTEQSVFRQDVAFKLFSSLKTKSLVANIDKCLPTEAMPPVEISWKFAKCFQTAYPEISLF